MRVTVDDAQLNLIKQQRDEMGWVANTADFSVMKWITTVRERMKIRT